MASRRKRKRERRRAENPALRGDRETPLRRERVALRHDWENPRRSDLHLFRRALRERWAIPPEHCRPLLDAALAAAFQGGSFRLRHVAMRALIDTGDYDLAMKRRERAARVAAYERAAEAAARGDIEAAVAAIESTLDTPEGLEVFDAVFNEVSRSESPGVAQDRPAPADDPPPSGRGVRAALP
jgi:hypothetical protein